MKHTLVIGYGNELRRDDGIGPFVAREVGACRFPGVIGLAVHQLVPEIAADLSCVQRAIFVDASAAGECVQVTKLAPAPMKAASVHYGDPAQLLGLAKQVYGRCPQAWMVTVPAHDMEFGEELSPEGRRGADEAIEAIKRLMNAD